MLYIATQQLKVFLCQDFSPPPTLSFSLSLPVFLSFTLPELLSLFFLHKCFSYFYYIKLSGWWKWLRNQDGDTRMASLHLYDSVKQK